MSILPTIISVLTSGLNALTQSSEQTRELKKGTDYPVPSPKLLIRCLHPTVDRAPVIRAPPVIAGVLHRLATEREPAESVRAEPVSRTWRCQRERSALTRSSR